MNELEEMFTHHKRLSLWIFKLCSEYSIIRAKTRFNVFQQRGYSFTNECFIGEFRTLKEAMECVVTENLRNVSSVNR